MTSTVKNSSVDLGVKSLHPPAEKLRRIGVIRYIHDRNPPIAKRLGRSPGRENLDTQLVESLRELKQPGFVGYGEKCLLYSHNADPERFLIVSPEVG